MATPLAIQPASKLFKGAFFAVEGGNYDLAFSNNNFVAEWKARIDIAKANGMNSFEFICSLNDWDSMGQGLLFAKYKQIFDYAGKVGMSVTLLGSGAMTDYSVSVSTSITRLIGLAQFACRWPGIILGLTCGDENIQSGGFANAANAVSQYNALKSAAGIDQNFPIAAASFFVQPGNAEWVDLEGYAAAADFFVVNLFGGDPSGSAWTHLRGAKPNHQFIFNVGYATSDGAFTTAFAASNILGTQNVVGVMVFTQEDYPGFPYGLYSAVGTSEKTVRTAAVKAAFGPYVPPVPSRKFRSGQPRTNLLSKQGIA